MDSDDTFPSGTYAGYKVDSAGLLSASVGASVTISTYNNGVLQENQDVVTALLGVDSALLNAEGSVTLGYSTTFPFDEIRIYYNNILSILFTGQVYHAVIKE